MRYYPWVSRAALALILVLLASSSCALLCVPGGAGARATAPAAAMPCHDEGRDAPPGPAPLQPDGSCLHCGQTGEPGSRPETGAPPMPEGTSALSPFLPHELAGAARARVPDLPASDVSPPAALRVLRI